MSSGAESAAVIAAPNTIVDRISKVQPDLTESQIEGSSAAEQQRSPLLRKFEQYLKEKLDDYYIDQDKDGVNIFNVNQVAYMMEGCKNRNQQRALKDKIWGRLSPQQVIPMKCLRSGHGEFPN